ncbi:MAG: DUF4258 domain-containing protein [Planctomycetes bacterium]|nr:DUF4258 domain-containing protein [Planctomycetota bacterium]
MKAIRLTRHAQEQALERGTDEQEVIAAIRLGLREPARSNRQLCRYNFPFGRTWGGKAYAIKQVSPVIVEEQHEIVVITVYTFFF